MRNPHLTSPHYRPDIDGLRAIAILSVVGFHAFPSLFSGGFIGVDIFFVISGFLISRIIISGLEQGDFSFTRFYSHRIKRIFPSLIAVFSFSYVFGWFFLLPDEFEQLGKHIAGGAGFISNFILWNESDYFNNITETKPMLHLWSLGIEEQFYILWPLLLWQMFKKRIDPFSLIVLLALISFGWQILNVLLDPVTTFFLPHTRFWELMLGALLACYIPLQKQRALPIFFKRIDGFLSICLYRSAREANGSALRNMSSLAGFLLAATGIFVIDKNDLFPGLWVLLPTCGAFLIISAGSQAWLNRTLLSNKLLVWVGLISYPLYLWHWPLLSFAQIIQGDLPSAQVRGCIILISIVLAWLTYTLVEKPIRFGQHKVIKTWLLLGAMLLMGSTGYYTYTAQGMAFRFPKMVQDLLLYIDKPEASYRQGTCFLQPEQNGDFSKCADDKDQNKKTLFLWGDSNAAHLYPGYKKIFADRYNIIQRTTSGCPPMLGVDFFYPNCRHINEAVFLMIKQQMPDKVVLAASWIDGQMYGLNNLENTVLRIQKLGITNIDLIGPCPEWSGGLPKQLYLKFKADRYGKIPERMWSGIRGEFAGGDSRMEILSEKMKVNYISPKKILCNEEGCITRLGETGDTLTAWDRNHLTEMGSQFLVSHFPDN